jgi:hypothetical protein
MTDIELEQTLARIRQLRIDSEHKEEDIRRILAEHDKTRQDITSSLPKIRRASSGFTVGLKTSVALIGSTASLRSWT